MDNNQKRYGFRFWAWLENEHPLAYLIIHGLIIAMAIAAIIQSYIS